VSYKCTVADCFNDTDIEGVVCNAHLPHPRSYHCEFDGCRNQVLEPGSVCYAAGCKSYDHQVPVPLPLEKTPHIFEAIPAVMADIKEIGKDQTNRSQNFKYRGIDDIYNALNSILARHGIFTAAKILGRERQQIQTKSGGTMWHVVLHFRFKFYCRDGSYIEADADGESVDSGDKASNKCASIAHKYALMMTFCIPTKDAPDPDAETAKLDDFSNSFG